MTTAPSPGEYIADAIEAMRFRPYHYCIKPPPWSPTGWGLFFGKIKEGAKALYYVEHYPTFSQALATWRRNEARRLPPASRGAPSEMGRHGAGGAA